jgi:hypothetical protein
VAAFRVKTGVPTLSCSETVREEAPEDAVRVTVLALDTAATFAVNTPVVDAAGTVRESGMVTEELFAESETVNPPVGAEPERLTVHESAIEPVIEVEPQEIALTVGATFVPVPLRLTAGVGVLLEIVSCPVTELAEVGSN